MVSVYKALDEKQRTKATVTRGVPGEHAKSVEFKAKAEDRPGLPIAELSKDQKTLVEKVMREKKAGTLRSGRSGRKVKSRKQAIAIGLSEARRAGNKVPKKKSA